MSAETVTEKRVASWARGNPASHTYEQIFLIDLGGGHWQVRRIGRHGGSRCWPTRELAQAAIDRQLDGEWEEVPANYGADAKPADPGPWERIGSRWRRPRA
jgi:hypothetical protein